MENELKEIVNLNKDVLLDNIGKIAYTIDKAWADQLTAFSCILGKDEYEVKDFYTSHVRSVKITRCVFDKDEKLDEVIKNIMSAFSDSDHTLALVVKRTSNNTELYFVVKNSIDDNEDCKSDGELLKSSIEGNFPGSDVGEASSQDDFHFSSYKSVAILMNLPSKFSKDHITQGLEKLFDGIVPKDKESYTVVFLAESLQQETVKEIIAGYEDMATILSPFTQRQLQIGKSDTKTQGESDSTTFSKNISDTISKTHSVNAGIFGGIKGIGGSLSYGYSWGKSHTEGSVESETTGTNRSFAFGTNESNTYMYKSYMVSNMLSRLEQIMKHITESKGTGLWKYAAYVLSDDAKMSRNIASFIKGITQGKESYNEISKIQVWQKSNDPESSFDKILKAISAFNHPVFSIKNGKEEIDVTATTYVGTTELSQVMAFPLHSVQGLPILHCARFGREPHKTTENENPGKSIELGNSYYMLKEDKCRAVLLSVQSLASHTFVTGSTGAGKTNTVCVLLDELKKQGVKFLVVEPAKGEYKDVFEGDVKVFGTNPKKSQLLRINPFSFEKDIHILEHLDRLIEIFNVCWPLYAAMPAVLKEAVEKSYEDVGWNLAESENCYEGEYGKRLFPNFSDVCRNIKTIIDNSEYDSDNKGAYKGSLLTRLKSLCNGINGLIFTDDEIAPSELFEKNVIVDLSRVGSAETKSLIMGLLVLKLQEYRMANGKPNNATLKHVTVLEEAHNLLKRTSTEQPSEGGNLLGKSVEMLTNSIAEMRSFGEGFIIADQAPALLDMVAIRNTNTKIIMRLPDFSDRELVGKAAGLNDDQIVELAKLPQGVAAVYQNDWVESVLCKVEKFPAESAAKKSDDLLVSENKTTKRALTVAEKLAIEKLLFNGEKPTFTMHDLQEMKLSARSKAIILDFMHSAKNVPQFIVPSPVIAEIFSETAGRLRRLVATTKDKEKWTSETSDAIKIEIGDNCNDCTDQFLCDIIQAIITQVVFNENGDKTLYNEWHEGGYLK